MSDDETAIRSQIPNGPATPVAEPRTSLTASQWIILCLVLTFGNMVWSGSLYFQDAHLKGSRKTFANVDRQLKGLPPLHDEIPRWCFYTVPAWLFVQFAISVVAVWRVRERRIWLGTVLLALWLVAFVASAGAFG